MEPGSSQRSRVGGQELIVTVLKQDCLSVMLFPTKTAKQCSRLSIGLCISQSCRISRPEGMKPWTDSSYLRADPALLEQGAGPERWTDHLRPAAGLCILQHPTGTGEVHRAFQDANCYARTG